MLFLLQCQGHCLVTFVELVLTLSTNLIKYMSGFVSSISTYIHEVHLYLHIVLTEVDNSFHHGSHKSTVFIHCTLFDKQR